MRFCHIIFFAVWMLSAFSLVLNADVATDRAEYLANYRSVDANRALARLEKLWRHELGQTMTCKRRAAETVAGYLKADGFSKIESIELPTDGSTACLDNRMPFAWEATVGRLTVVPGRSPEEFWLHAHMYESLASDDSCGVVAAIETARRFIGKKNPPEYTIRVLFGIEYYGYAAYLKHVGCPLRDKVVGALNFDSTPCHRGTYFNFQLGAPATPYCGNLVLESLAGSLKGMPESLDYKTVRMGLYFDDYFIADKTIGVPMAGLLNAFRGTRFWHSSQMDFEHMDSEIYRRSLAFAATYVDRMANPTAAFLRRNPAAVRSAHLARSWTGTGPLAAECLGKQRPDSAPYGDDSPIAQALARGGKFVHIGSSPDFRELRRHISVRQGTIRTSPAIVGKRQADGFSADVVVPEFPIDEEIPPLPKGLMVTKAKLGLSSVNVVSTH